MTRNQTALKSEPCGRDSPEDAVTLWHIDESSTAGSWNDADPSQARAFVCNGDPNSNTGSAADPARLGTGLPGDAEISLEDAVRLFSQ